MSTPMPPAGSTEAARRHTAHSAQLAALRATAADQAAQVRAVQADLDDLAQAIAGLRAASGTQVTLHLAPEVTSALAAAAAPVDTDPAPVAPPAVAPSAAVSSGTGRWWLQPSAWRKGQAALAVIVGILVAQGLLTGQAEHIATTAIAVVGALLTILVPNAPVQADPPDPEGAP